MYITRLFLLIQQNQFISQSIISNLSTQDAQNFMTEATLQIYQQLLKQFYRKTIRTHPNRHDLFDKFIKANAALKQDKLTETENNTSTTHGSHPKVNVLAINTSSKNKLTSSREIQVQSPLFSNKISDDKSSISGDSDIEKLAKRNHEQEKYFNVEWIYKSNNFKKTLVFAFVYLCFQFNDIENFKRLRDNIELFFEQQQNQQAFDSAIRNGAVQWSKIDQTFEKKDRVRWTKILPEIFINLSIPFINLIFQLLARIKMDDIKSPCKKTIDSISRHLKINIGYFEIFHFEMQRQIEKSQLYKIDLNIGYVKEEDSFVLSNRYPQKSENDKKKDKIIKNISESIASLLKEYDANTEKLMNLNILSDLSSNDHYELNEVTKKK